MSAALARRWSPAAGLGIGWYAVAAVTIGLGLMTAALLQPWRLDFLDWRRVLEAGDAWARGQSPYAVPGYFYTPALAVLAAWLPDASTILVVLAGTATAVALAPRHPIAVLAVLCYPPVWGDLALGNVTILLTGAVVLALGEDRPLRGVPLGLGLALVPKPMFIPVLLWMLVHRRRSLAGVVAAGLAVTLPALLTGLYPSFVGALMRGITPDFAGNLSITTLVPWAGVPISMLAVLVALAAVRREASGLMAAAIAGSLVGTYVGVYAPVLAAGILPRYELVHPKRALVLAAIGSVAVLALPLAAALAIAVTVLAGRPGCPSSNTAD